MLLCANWDLVDVTNTYSGSSAWTYYDKNNTVCTFYRNEQTHSCIVTVHTVTITEVPENTAVAIGSNAILNTYKPKCSIAAPFSLQNAIVLLIKNGTNESLALTTRMGSIPSGTTIEMQLEWHYF